MPKEQFRQNPPAGTEKKLSRACLAFVLSFNSLLVGQSPAKNAIAEVDRLNRETAKLYSNGNFGPALEAAKRALALAEASLGAEHPGTATSLSNLADIYQAQGVYVKAGPLYQRALAIREKVLGPQHPDTAASLTNLALLYEAQRAYGKAEPLCQRALAIYEKVRGPEHPDTATQDVTFRIEWHRSSTLFGTPAVPQDGKLPFQDVTQYSFATLKRRKLNGSRGVAQSLGNVDWYGLMAGPVHGRNRDLSRCICERLDKMVSKETRRLYAEEVGTMANIGSAALLEALAVVPREDFVGQGPWKILSKPAPGQKQPQMTEVSET